MLVLYNYGTGLLISAYKVCQYLDYSVGEFRTILIYRNLGECYKLLYSMNLPDHPLLQKSISLLREHPDLTTDRIPDEILNYLTLPHISEAYNKKHFQGFAFFMVLFSAYKCMDPDVIIQSKELDKISYDGDIDELHRYLGKFQQNLMSEQLCRKLGIQMAPVRIFDIMHYPPGIQLAISKSEVEKARIFQAMMKERGIDL